MTDQAFSRRPDQRADHETPEQIAASRKALAWSTLMGVKRARKRGAWCSHMMRATSRRYLIASLELAACYRRSAAKAHAEAKATARARLFAMMRDTLDAA